MRQVWIERAAEIAKEYYLSVTFDRGARRPLLMFTTRGGVDIEQVAAETPEALARVHVDPLEGYRPRPRRGELIYGAGIADAERAAADRGDRRAALPLLRRVATRCSARSTR